MWNYAVIGVALIAEGTSWVIAIREFLPTVKNESIWRALRSAKDATTVSVILEDSAALAGLLFCADRGLPQPSHGQPGLGWSRLHDDRSDALGRGLLPGL